MGYYTYYTLSVKGIRCDEKETLRNALSNATMYGYALYNDPWESADGTIQYDGDESVKWYEHDEDMLKLSKSFPNAVFKLHGEGEEIGDVWDTYYYNGIMEYCPYVPKKPQTIRWE